MEDSGSSKRRRGLGVVTPNACTECRKKRAKCDGKNPCGRCALQKVDCKYEIPVRQSKDHMRTEIDQLRKEKEQSGRILTALATIDNPETVLNQLRSGESIEKISSRLDEDRPVANPASTPEENARAAIFAPMSGHQTIASVLQIKRVGSPAVGSGGSANMDDDAVSQMGNLTNNPSSWRSWGSSASPSLGEPSAVRSEDMSGRPPESQPSSSHDHYMRFSPSWHDSASSNVGLDSYSRWAREEGKGLILGTAFGEHNSSNRSQHIVQNWTEVTSDTDLVEHLMALYFCWEYPTFAPLSKEHFLEDFRKGNPRHCSSLLVNSILSIGSRFSPKASAQTDPGDSNSAGDHFFAEALRILDAESNHHKLTTIQALGLMSIREASYGRSTESIYYSGQSVRIAIEMGLHLESESGGGDDASVDNAVKSVTFWGAFALDQAWSLSIGRLPHFSKETKVMAKPAIVAHVEKAHWVPYTDDGVPVHRQWSQPSNVRSVYRTFCELSEIVHRSLYIFYTPGMELTSKALLDVYTQYLSWYDSIPEVLRLGQNFTPYVLFAHMYYHFAILLLFRPFIKLNITGSSLSPRDVCSQAAEAISTLVKSYSQLYTLKHTPAFVPYFVLTASITHLVVLGTTKGKPDHVHQGIADLKIMAAYHEFAAQACDILVYLADLWEVDITFERGDPKQDPKSLGRPRSTSSNFFAPNVQAEDFVGGIKPITDINHNPIFWPFPLQGRPLIGVGALLDKAGFSIYVPDTDLGDVVMENIHASGVGDEGDGLSAADRVR